MWNYETAMQFVPPLPGRKLKNLETSRILALFSDALQAEAACKSLSEVGFADSSVRSFAGPKGQRDLDIKGEHHGVLQHLRQRWHHLMYEECVQWDHYEQALARGDWIVQVKTDPATWELAHEVLRANNGHFIHFYGLLTTKTLDP